MKTKCTVGNPGTIYDAFTLAAMELRYNEAVRRIDPSPAIQDALAQKLDELGQYRFINLTHNTDQSRIALAMYAGDGIVVKIIPANYLGQPNAIYHVPSISSHRVKVDYKDFAGEEQHDEFVIKTYPWIAPGGIEPADVEEFTRHVAKVGMSINEGDAHPKNIHRLPGTSRMIGIDSAMYNLTHASFTEKMENGWHDYMHQLYPIYDIGYVDPQSAATNFNFVSLHDRSKERMRFDDATGEVVMPIERRGDESMVEALMRHLRIGRRSSATAGNDSGPKVEA
jgi:hypothetical protein